MYIPIGPSKKDLYKIIIGLLLIVYFIFIGIYKPKAEVLNSDNFLVQTYASNNFIGNGSLSSRYGGVSTYITASGNANIVYFLWNQSQVTFSNTKDLVIVNFSLTLDYSDYMPNIINTKLLNNACYTDFHITQSSNQMYNDISGTSYCVINTNGWGKYEQVFTINLDASFPITRVTISDLSFLNQNQSSAISQQINNNVNNINNSINDSSIDSSSANDLTSNSAFQDSNGLDAIIKAPLNFIQSLTSSTCSAINLTIPYIEADVSLPCMSSVYTKALGTQLVNLIALVINGVVLYRYCLKILQLVHNAKNPNKDELEVLDL